MRFSPSMREAGTFNTPLTRSAIGNFNATIANGDFAVQRTTNNGQMLVELSIDPLTEDKESYLEYNGTVRPPFNLDVPFSISQRARNTYFQLEAIQKVDASLVSVPEAPIAITSYSQSTTVITIVLATPTTIQRGEWFDVYGIDNSLCNISNANVATVSADRKTITCSYTDDTIVTSQTISAVTNMGYFRKQALAIKEPNGSGIKFTKSVATVANLFSRAMSGNVRNGSIYAADQALSISSTASVISNGANGQFEIKPTSSFEISVDKNSVGFLDYVVDSTASQSTVRLLQEMSVPEYYAGYTPRLRAVSPRSMSRPIAKIVSAVKTGTTTATITTDVPHGLTANKSVVDVYGMRDVTNFIGTTGLTVASTPTTTSFTVVIAGAVTATTYGGFVALKNNGIALTGLSPQAIQSISIDTDGILSVVGNTTWTALTVGEFVNIYGCRADTTGADMGLDGAYELIDLSTTTLKLRAIKNPDGTNTKDGSGNNVTPALLVTASTNCGGSVIMRTTGRIHDLRMEERSYDAVKIWGQGESRTDLALPITVQNIPSVYVNPALGVNAHALTTAATTNATSIRTSSSTVSAFVINNMSASAIYFKLYNKASAPTVGTDIPVLTFLVAANSTLPIEFGLLGIRFSTGIAYAITGAQADADTTAIAAGCKVMLQHT